MTLAYEDLRSLIKERTRPFVFWVGAGLSREAGLPSWYELRKAVASAIREELETIKNSGERDGQLKRVRAALQTEDLWLSFDIFREIAPTTFEVSVRRSLSPAKHHQTPAGYKTLWRLGPRGILTTNLDRFASSAHALADVGGSPAEFSGQEAGNYVHLLTSMTKFVVNLHGTVNNAASWVLSRSSLDRLMGAVGYRYFLASLLSSNVVILLSISADDYAVAEHFQALRRAGADFAPPYWITARNDFETFRWTQQMGIQPVFYEARDATHSRLTSILNDLDSFTPVDDVPAPISLRGGPEKSRTLPSNDVLLTKSAEEIRKELNAHAKSLLAVASQEDYVRFGRFVDEYDESIHRAWYVSLAPPKNVLLGYQLEGEIAKGAFGRVFLATDPDGQRVAIKVLREEIRTRKDSLQCFRRGVRSMRILSENRISGMVVFRDASEIPTMVVMDYVEGFNLDQALRAGLFDSWTSVLHFSCELAQTLADAHALPERVLHRDVRPANVMLMVDAEAFLGYRLVVLDFDLSWHRGALEVSVTQDAVSGYLAPEQLDDRSEVSTRSALVDSYGFGMTLYFLISGEEPSVFSHRYATWNETLIKAVRGRPCDSWRSLPIRMARLMERSTREVQSERPDMHQILAELEQLKDLEKGGEGRTAEVLAEELVFRALDGRQYTWDDNSSKAIATLGGGVRSFVWGDETERVVGLILERPDEGTGDRKQVGKYAARTARDVPEKLKSAGWRIRTASSEAKSVYVEASLSVSQLKDDLPRQAAVLQLVLQGMSF